MSIEEQIRAKGIKLVPSKSTKTTSKKTTKASSKAPATKVVAKPAMVLAAEPESTPTPKSKFNFSALKSAPKLGGGGGRLIPTAAEIRTMGEELVTFKKDVGPYMHDLVSQLWDAYLAPPEVAAALAEAKSSLEGSIREILDSSEPYRTPGRIAWADAVIKTAPDPFRNRGILTAVIERLQEEKFLTVGVGAGFKHVGKNYVLAADLVVREDAQAVMRSLMELRERGSETEREETKSELDQLQATAVKNLVTFDDLMAGKDGYVIVDVPDQHTTDGKFFGGGTILVQSVDGAVRIVDGAGRIRRRALNLNDTGVAVAVASLAEEKPKFDNSSWRDQLGIHGLIRRFINKEDDAKRRVEKMAEEKVAAANRVAEAKTRFKEAADKEYEVLVGKGNLSFDEFFAGNDGVFAFRLGMFEDQSAGRRVWQVMCLLERRTGDGWIRMVECPDRLKEFFGADVSAPLAPGKRFDKIPNPLGILLRMGLSGFEKKQKAAADQTAEKAPEAEATDEQVAV